MGRGLPSFGNCTIADNEGVYGGGFYLVTITVRITNTIFYGNTGYDPDIYIDWLAVVQVNYCDIDGSWGGAGNISADPLFIDSVAGNYRLGPVSPCIDAGTDFFQIEGDTLINIPADEYSGTAPDLGPWEFQSLSGLGEGTPAVARLLGNYPNPFNPSTTIAFSLPTAQAVDLVIYDSAGRKVADLLDGFLEPGRHQAVWNGRDDQGFKLASGLYWCRLQTMDSVLTGGMTLIK